MKNAKELMLEYTAFSFKDPKTAAEMFAEDGAFELPYLATFGLPTQYRGRDAIAAFFQSVLDIYPGFKFENTKVLIDTPDQALQNSRPGRCPAKRDDPFINSSLLAWLPRTERSNCLEKL
jgi:hypothetical protein